MEHEKKRKDANEKNSGQSNEVDDEEKAKTKAKKNFKNIFKLNSFDFKKKHSYVFSVKRTKSSEFEDLALDMNNSRKLFSLRKQCSRESLVDTELRSSRSDKALNVDKSDFSNGNQSPSKNDNLSVEVESTKDDTKDKISLVEKENDDAQNDNAVKSKSDSSIYLDGLAEMSSEEERVMEGADEEIRKLKEANYPDCAIIGNRRVLLDMKGLRRQLERTQDMYLSPVYAPDSALKKLNCISFVVSVLMREKPR